MLSGQGDGGVVSCLAHVVDVNARIVTVYQAVSFFFSLFLFDACCGHSEELQPLEGQGLRLRHEVGGLV